MQDLIGEVGGWVCNWKRVVTNGLTGTQDGCRFMLRNHEFHLGMEDTKEVFGTRYG